MVFIISFAAFPPATLINIYSIFFGKSSLCPESITAIPSSSGSKPLILNLQK